MLFAHTLGVVVEGPHFLGRDFAVLVAVDFGVEGEQALLAEEGVGHLLLDAEDGVVDPVGQLCPHCLQVLGGQFCYCSVFGFVLVGGGVALHEVGQFCFGEEGGVGEVEVVLLHAVVAAGCLPVVTVLRHAELGDPLTVLTPVHTI